MKNIQYIMPIKKNYAIAIMDTEKIDEFDEIISKYTNAIKKSYSHIFFDTQPVSSEDITHDITFFRLEGESESVLDEKINKIIEELNELDSDYTLRDEESGKMIVAIDFVGMLIIKFNDIDRINEGTYKRIDELKKTKGEFGYCKGYKPDFRPREGTQIENVKIHPEKIFLFSDSRENILKLKDYLSEKVIKIDSNLKVEFKPFT